MDQRYWFGITCSFVCSRCNGLSSEKFLVHSTTDDHAKISQKLQAQKLCCQHCHFQIPDCTQVTADVIGGTLEFLQTKGFRFPSADN